MWQRVHNHCTFCCSQQNVTQTNERTGWQDIVKSCRTARRLLLTAHFRTTLPKLLAYCAHKFRAHFDHQLFNWLFRDTIFFNRHYLRTADLKLVAFAAHRFDKHTKMELTTSRYSIANTIIFDTQAHVGFKLFFEAIANLSTRREVTFFPLHWARVWPKIHTECWRFDVNGWQRLRRIFVGNRLTNMRIRNTHKRNDITRIGVFDFFFCEATVAKNLFNFTCNLRAVALNKRHRAALGHTTCNTTNCVLAQE